MLSQRQILGEMNYPEQKLDLGDYYNEKIPWNMNPREQFSGHFKIPGTDKRTRDLKILARLTIIDRLEREHILLPTEWDFKVSKHKIRENGEEKEIELQLRVPEPSPGIELPKKWKSELHIWAIVPSCCNDDQVLFTGQDILIY